MDANEMWEEGDVIGNSRGNDANDIEGWHDERGMIYWDDEELDNRGSYIHRIEYITDGYILQQ